MSNIQIQVLSSTKVGAVAKNGKPYDKLDLAFKNLTFGNKVEGKVIMPFGSTKPAFETLSNAQGGQTFEITIVKSAAGYNDWTEAKPITVSAAAANTPTAPKASAASGSGTWASAEERAKVQVYIVRQSTISNAVAALSVGSKTPPAAAAVIEYAKTLEAHVFGKAVNDDSFELEVPKDEDEADVPY